MNQYRINYPDGGRQHVRAKERDELLLNGRIQPTDQPREYRYVGQVITLHSMPELGKLHLIRPRTEPNYYPGTFKVKFGDKITFERMESAERLAVRVTNSAQSDRLEP